MRCYARYVYSRAIKSHGECLPVVPGPQKSFRIRHTRDSQVSFHFDVSRLHRDTFPSCRMAFRVYTPFSSRYLRFCLSTVIVVGVVSQKRKFKKYSIRFRRETRQIGYRVSDMKTKVRKTKLLVVRKIDRRRESR